MTVIHIFRKDYRIEDNTALNKALATNNEVLPIFIFDPRQQRDSNEYFAEHAFTFLVESLKELNTELHKKNTKLHVFEGNPEKIIAHLITKYSITDIFVNRDYTPFSKKRDADLEKVCHTMNVSFHCVEDALLHPIETIKNKEGNPYKVFTPFYKEGMKHEIAHPKTVSGHWKLIEEGTSLDSITVKNVKMAVTPGRKSALDILSNLSEHTAYKQKRDFPSVQGTSMLSAHHKFGTVSPREVAYAIKATLGDEHPLLRQLYWRDFYYSIMHHFDVIGNEFNSDFQSITWENDADKFDRWKRGMTGFPIVDAGMRELVQTGYMHNRVRMITASFLTKDLHIDWRWGEKFFAQYLVDYDPAQNNGNWQWTASTGADGAPYFRIFSPWRQQLRFDPDCLYIKKWVPELSDLEPKAIHGMEKSRPLHLQGSSYPLPMLDHRDEASKAKEYYKVAKDN